MSTSRFALFVDLENCGAKAATLNNILDKVKIRGDILLGKGSTLWRWPTPTR